MKVNGKDYSIYEMENKIHVPNHQPAKWVILISFIHHVDPKGKGNLKKLLRHALRQHSLSPRHIDGLSLLERSEKRDDFNVISMDWFKGQFTGKPHI